MCTRLQQAHLTLMRACARARVCVCVCVRARARVCVCVFVCARGWVGGYLLRF